MVSKEKQEIGQAAKLTRQSSLESDDLFLYGPNAYCVFCFE